MNGGDKYSNILMFDAAAFQLVLFHYPYQWVAIFLVSDLPAVFLAKPCSEAVFLIFVAGADGRSPTTGNQPYHLLQGGRAMEKHGLLGATNVSGQLKQINRRSPRMWSQSKTSMRGRIASYCVKPSDSQKGIRPCLGSLVVTEAATAASCQID